MAKLATPQRNRQARASAGICAKTNRPSRHSALTPKASGSEWRKPLSASRPPSRLPTVRPTPNSSRAKLAFSLLKPETSRSSGLM
ncbi:hypothetical protein D3C85_1575440 [compost metagenome]